VDSGREGLLRGTGFRDGQWRDCFIYGIIRDDISGSSDQPDLDDLSEICGLQLAVILRSESALGSHAALQTGLR
jgi:hypothetical protein